MKAEVVLLATLRSLQPFWRVAVVVLWTVAQWYHSGPSKQVAVCTWSAGCAALLNVVVSIILHHQQSRDGAYTGILAP